MRVPVWIEKRHDGSEMSAQLPYWIAAASVAGLVVLAALAERRRSRRRDLEAIGWVPWRGIQVGACFLLVLILVLATHR